MHHKDETVSDNKVFSEQHEAERLLCDNACTSYVKTHLYT